ncbi:MAG: lipoate--protein ligase family protein [Verrucomicrobiota bacterium]|jgi:lipoate-protein ligase A
MKHFDLTLPSPAENLACDEALLNWCEDGGGEEIIRFWELAETFVVVGYANRVATEVNVAACKARGIPILRRCSGGGTVLQGAGCLNYTLVLRIAENSLLAGISSANQFIMERNRAAIESLYKTLNPQLSTFDLTVCGHTDLAIGGRKFSGNSQRRKKNFLLFHGTFLLNLDFALVNEFLEIPSKQPDYRRNRSHNEFLTNLKMPADKVKGVLAAAWNADEPLTNPPLEEIPKLTAQKYLTRDWNFKF